MTIHLSDHFTYKKLLRFTFPSIIMMIFTSIYGVVDGLFVSNFVGKTAFASVNLVMPFLMVMGGVGAMVGTGGSALVAKTLGEGDSNKANRYFTMMIRLIAIIGVVFTVIGLLCIRPVSYMLGATEAMIDDCVLYGRVVLLFNIALLLQYTFQSFLITAERAKFGLLVTVLAGITNMVLDAVFVGVFRWGLAGAAFATGLSQCVGGIIPLIFFARKNNGCNLQFAKTRFEIQPIIKACTNGASEMLSTVSGSLIGILYNWQLTRYAGENGVAAYGVIMYASMIFIAVFMGYSTGSAPIVGYHFGAGNHTEMKNMLKKSLKIVVGAGCLMLLAGLTLAVPLSRIFVGYDAELLELTVHAFRVSSIPFLYMGVSIYGSSFFTALNDGGVSAALSFLRSLVFNVAVILIMPPLFGVDGIWWSLVVSEGLALAVTFVFLLIKRKKYQYW